MFSKLRSWTERIGFVRTIAFMLFATVAVIGCSWSLLSDRSVRFNDDRSGRGFYRLPPLPIMYDPVSGKEIGTNESYYYGESEYVSEEQERKPNANDPEELWKIAGAAIENVEFQKLDEILKSYLSATEYLYSSDKNAYQEPRNSAYDMLDALSAVKQGSRPEAVKQYLQARYTIHAASDEPDVADIVQDKNLQDNWDYLAAAKLMLAGNSEEALTAFAAFQTKHRSSEKLPAAAYTMARLNLEKSVSFEDASCGVVRSGSSDSDGQTTGDRPAAECRDSHWENALSQFRSYLRRYPDGRYAFDSRGWLAFLYKRGGDRAEALAEYYRLLGNPTDRKWRLEAKKSLQIIGHEYDDKTLDKVESLISSDPSAALAYAYHRIYNHAVDLSYAEKDRWCCSGDDRWAESAREEQRVRESVNAGRHELERVAKFSSRMMSKFPGTRVHASFVLRVAQAQLELENYEEALSLAKRALARGARSDDRAQAFWIKGSSHHFRKEYSEAKGSFELLLKEFPAHKLSEGARRLLAMTAEDQGDLEGALDQYLKLGYEYDVAYFVDVLLPVERLAKYAHSHSDSVYRDYLRYAVAIRYMRDSRWDEARVEFQKIVTTPGQQKWAYENEGIPKPKEPDWTDGINTKINQNWVAADLRTVDRLQAFDGRIKAAQTDEEIAEAKYQLASFLYQGDQLSFYNPAAWGGGRADLLYSLSWSDQQRAPNEFQLIFDHSRDHETISRAIANYLEIADTYPKTKAARDALYSAAVAHERLSGFNSYWSQIYQNGLFAGSRKVNYSDVRKAYPFYQLPRGTDGWEPATRTVNGGPGWAAPPNPKPRLTFTQRAYKKVSNYAQSYTPAFFAWAGSTWEDFLFFVKVHFYTMLIGLIGSTFFLNRVQFIYGPARRLHSFGTMAAPAVNRRFMAILAKLSLPRLSFGYFLRRVFGFGSTLEDEDNSAEMADRSTDNESSEGK